MSTTETNAIDEKKENQTNNSNVSKNINIKGFFVSYISSLIFTIGISIFIVGTLGLFTSKVAQSNILPCDRNLAPYGEFNRVVNDIPIDINIVKNISLSGSEKSDNFISQKAIFDSKKYLESFKNSFLCLLFKNANPSNGFFSNFTLFLSKIMSDMYAKNFSAINTIFTYLSYLPESLIMILYGFFGIFLWIGLYFFNFILSIFYHITNIPQLFKNISDNDESKWQSDSKIGFSIIKFLLFWFLWLPLGFISSLLLPIYTTLYSLISPLYAKYKIQDKEMNVFDFIVNTLYYKKSMFLILASVSLASNANTYLGTASLIGVLIAVIIGYYVGIYNNPVEDLNNDFTSGLANLEIKNAKVKEGEKIIICNKIKEETTIESQSGGGKKKISNKKYNIKLV